MADESEPIYFRPRGRAQTKDRHREVAAKAYIAQADDERRFDAATKQLLDGLDLSGGVVTVMNCDHRFVPLLENWARSCVSSGVEFRSNTLVFPTDLEAHERAERLGLVSYFDADSTFLASLNDSARYGDQNWTRYMFHQNWVIKKALALGVDVLFQDVDVVWRRDPRPYLRAHARTGADIQAMFDGPNPRFQPLHANSGFLYLRNTHTVRAFWDQVFDRHDMVAYYQSQQEPLNMMLAVHAHRDLDVRILDEERFANGHRYCGPRVAPPDDPWVIHVSWTADLDEKLRRYDEFGLWYPEEKRGFRRLLARPRRVRWPRSVAGPRR